MNSNPTLDASLAPFEEHQVSCLKEVLGATIILLISPIQAISSPAHYERIATRVAHLILVYSDKELDLLHLVNLKDLGSEVWRAVDQIVTFLRECRAQSAILRIIYYRANTNRLNRYKEQLDIAVDAFKLYSVYEGDHPVLNILIEQFRELIIEIRDAVMQHLERKPLRVGPTQWFRALFGGRDVGPLGSTPQSIISTPTSYHTYGTHCYAPVSQTHPPSFMPPQPIHVTINIGSGNTMNSTLRNVSNDNSENYRSH